MEAAAKIILSKGRDEAVRRFHPWVFSGAISRAEGKPVDGDMVEVCDFQGKTLGYGHACSGSIAVKLLHFGETRPGDDFWYRKLSACYQLRKDTGFTGNHQSNAYRLVFSEGDGLPGLIVDYYNGVAVLQAHSTGMYINRMQLAEALKQLYGSGLKAIYDKSAEALGKSGAHSEGDGYLFGEEGVAEILENGHRFQIDFINGQKTGFFLDQRDNRAMLARFANGRKVLNAFCYTGGFSVYALAAGALHVTSLDSSRKAMETLEVNLRLNGLEAESHESVVDDAKSYLTRIPEDFDVIVLDPPAFAKRHADRHKALQGYRFINAAAMKKIKPGGFLFTFSCSQAMSREMFISMAMSAGMEAGRDVRIVHHLGHSADHPVSIFHPEGEYLKGLVLRVE
ncbi:Ribosomal RNA large subunit methyltransferase I [bioreactor metagenome]|uniref:Ribosomal RNA large subunit methyltransferase I n=1 Tax=bioreactor metagenome TaxID=1076179 RepID=A0A644USA7_9ZZZZ|nr:class I SAM-dependent rRNA methyltransferase [Lentimicrobium sp.]MEA5111874.1 class I SAM-dependent rRNA methyltransferase [Lentimicrobium sp.]